MAEEIKSTFGEVLELRVDAPLFEQELNKLTQVYNKWVESLGANAKDVLGAGAVTSLNAEVQEGMQLITLMSQQSFAAIENLTETMVQFAQKSDQVLETIAGKQVTRSRKVVEETKRAAEEAARSQDSLTGRTSSLSSAQNIDNEQAGIENKFLETQQFEKTALVSKVIAEIKKEQLAADRETVKLLQQELDLLEQQQLAIEKNATNRAQSVAKDDLADQERAYLEIIAQEKALESEIAAQRKQSQRDRQLQMEIEGGFNQAEAEADKQTIAAFKEELRLMDQIERVNARRVRPGEGTEAAELQARIENERRLANAERERFQTELELDRLQRRQDLAGAGTDLQARVNILQRQSQELQRQIESYRQLGKAESQLLTLEKERIGINERLNRAQADLNKSQSGFFEKFNSNLFGSIVGLTRMFVVLRGVGLAFQGLQLAAEAPFKAVFAGLDILKKSETAATSLVATLLQTVQLSQDKVDNMRLIQESSVAIVKEFQDVGAKLNIQPDTLLNTFKALIEGGLGKYVTNLKDATKITVQFQQALNAVGAGGLVAQTSVQEVSKLLLGTPNGESPFLKALGLANQPGTWIKIREEAKKTGDLIGVLASRSEAFATALKESGKTQESITNSTKLLLERISGIAANALFDEITKGLLMIQDFVTRNQDKIEAFVRIFANGLSAVLITVEGAAQSGALDVVAALFGAIAEAVAILVVGLGQAINLISALVKSVVTFSTTPLKDFANNFDKAMGAIFDETEKKGSSTADILKKKFADINTNQGKVPTTADVSGRFGEDREKLEKELKVIEARFSEARDAIREQVAEGKKSQVDAAKEVAASLAAEAAAYEIVEGKLRKVTTTALSASKALFVTDPEGSKREVSRYTKELTRLDEEQITRKQRLTKIQSEFDRAAAREGVEILKLTNEDRRKAIEEAAKAEFDVRRELAQQGFLTEVELFNEETRIEEIRHKNQVERLQEEIAQFGDGTKQKTEALLKLADEDRKYTETVKLNAEQRKRIVDQESARILNDLKQRREASIERQQDALEVLRMSEPGLDLTSQFDALLSARERENRTLIENTQQRLAAASALGTESKRVAELSSQLDTLYGNENKLLRQRIENGVSGISNGAIRQFRVQQIVRQDAQERNAGTLNTTSVGQVALRDVARSFRDAFLGQGTIATYKAAQSGIQKFGIATAAAVNGLQSLGNVLGAFKQGKEQGGVLGGIGAVAGQFGNLPIVGPYIAAIGGALSFVGQLFTAAAKRIAEDIKKSFQKTIDNYQNGNATLIETLNALDRQRSDAIIRLSGKKGGKDELDKILPEFDREIASLKQQQKQIVEGFEESLAVLRLQSDTLAQVHKQWSDINKQVKDYLSAGGDAAKASEFLSLSLANIRQQAADELDQSEQDAIQNVLKLNDLLKQRQQLVDDFKQKEFDLINADAIERRQAGSVTRGKQLEDLRKQHQEQIDNIDSEIKATQVRVDKEREIFNLSTDISAVRRRDEELTLKALDAQIQKLKDLKSIAAGIGFNAALPTSNVSQTFNVDIQINGDQDSGRRAADQFMDEVNRQMRFAPA
jgi:hypothetical protein